LLSVTPESRIGIGTPNPQADLHIFSPGGAIRITDSDACPNPSAAWEIEEDLGKLMFEVVSNCPGDPTGGKMWITGAGNLGIGTSAPQGRLHVTGPGSSSHLRLQAGAGYRDLVALSDGGFEIQGDGGGSERVVRVFPDAPDNSLVLHPTGIGIGTGSPQAKLHVLGSAIIVGDVALGSSRTFKHDIEPQSGTEILAALRKLSVYTWRYKEDPVQAMHVGPMAEEVRAVFGVGRDEKLLSPADSAGLALAAIKGVDERLTTELDELRATLARLAAMNAHLVSENESLHRSLAGVNSNPGL
jgi:hypothetical protein